MTEISNFIKKEEPHLIKADGAFCSLNTVEYKGKLLYSKYNPKKTILTYIENLQLLPGTIILLCSPLLFYGLDELLQKLPLNCKIIAFEADKNLFDFSKNFLSESKKDIKFFNLSNILELDEYARKLVESGDYRRILSINFSAGIQFAKEKYEEVASGLQEIITVFWKNRITLQKLGKLYSKNILKNLSYLKNSEQLFDKKNYVSKNILVCGAGESLDNFAHWNEVKDKFFIIAVDAAARSLCEKNVIPDAIVALEPQFAIQKSYIGLKKFFDKKEPVLFSDLCARNEVCNLFSKKIFFLSKFSESKFIKNLEDKKIVRSIIEPMGSVGLAATYIALKIRESENVKIFTLGLDFAFSAGKTHAKAAQASLNLFLLQNKFHSAQNYNACFSKNSISFCTKDEKISYTSEALKNYAIQFKNMFSKEKNIFNLSNFGFDTGLPFKADFDDFLNKENKILKNEELFVKSENSSMTKKIENFFAEEILALEKAKSLLADGEKSEYREKNLSLQEQLKSLLECRDYLYLHFPDGQKFSFEISFLKRIRAEINFFLKQLKEASKNN